MKAGWTISAVLHGAVLAWGLVTFASKPLNATPPEFISTDIISDAEFSQITQRIRTAPKTEARKPLVEKIAEALFATAIGLVAAIPATIFYNKFVSEVNKQAQRLEGFADEFAAILSRQIDEAA